MTFIIPMLINMGTACPAVPLGGDKEPRAKKLLVRTLLRHGCHCSRETQFSLICSLDGSRGLFSTFIMYCIQYSNVRIQKNTNVLFLRLGWDYSRALSCIQYAPSLGYVQYVSSKVRFGRCSVGMTIKKLQISSWLCNCKQFLNTAW